MENRSVKDLVVPLDEYPVVPEDANLLDAILALDEAQRKLPPGRQPYRAVLVIDANGKIIGKIGQLAFMKALEPKYSVLGDLRTLARAGVTAEFVSSMMDHYQFFQDSFADLCTRGRSLPVKDVMHPVTESVDENASLSDAAHKIVIWQTLSLLVTRGEEVVGLLRLSDLFEELTAQMMVLASKD